MNDAYPPRKTSHRVATSPGCAPLLRMYEQVVERRARTWPEVEEDFLAAMWRFDENFRTGKADQGDNQNGKGDFFTDLIALLLEASSGKPLFGRGAVPGLFFEKHHLDASFPPVGPVEVLIETKAAGAPKTGRNPQQKNVRGRPASSDLKKRVTEAGLKTIDLKAEWARVEGQGRGPAGDLVTWIRQSKPLCFLILAVRVVDTNDLRKTISLADSATRMMDDVGIVAYQPDLEAGEYRPLPVPTSMQLDRVLSRISTALRQLPSP